MPSSSSPKRVLALCALLLPGLALASPQTPTDAPPPVPAPASRSSAPPLAARLASLLRAPAFNQEETGVSVVLLPEARPFFTRLGDRPLRPASTMKILTTAAALALLKPEYVFETRILADAPIDAAGTIAGNLYLQGRGAPDLVGESWWLMARRLAGLGLRRVEGDLVADETYFDAQRRPPGWPEPLADSWYNAPIGALSCNFNVVSVRIDPSPLLGARPDITLEPIASFFQVLNRATTTSGPTSIQVNRSFEAGANTLVVAGSVRRGAGSTLVNRSVEEPAQYALHAFRDMAQSQGIAVQGGLTVGPAPESARLLHRHESRPLDALLRDMNKNSSNFMAEAIVKTLGAQFQAQPGTTAGGLDVVRAYLAGIGVDAGGAALADGSGLSDLDRLPARVLTGVLARAYDDFEVGPELVASFPVGGADGTLDERFGGPEARRVRAKTGRIAGALSLAGYAANRSGKVFAFAVLANKPRGSIDAVHRAMDRMVDEIIGSTDADLVPRLD